LPDSRTRVLVIDSHRPSLAALQALLIDEGYVVDTARSGAEGVALAQARIPDVVLTDLNIPGMIGIGSWHALSPDLPVIVVTVWADRASATDALRAGAEDYLTKPVDFAALLLSIERATTPRGATTERRRQPLRRRATALCQGNAYEPERAA
jgi:two-component system response regulator HydG